MKIRVRWTAVFLVLLKLCSFDGWALEQDLPVSEKVVCEHEYTTIVTPPTCTSRGRTLHLCEKCGNSYVSDYREPLTHEMTEWVPQEGYQGSVHSVCHRGSSLAPENTLAAFELAKKQGYTYVETDVQFTKDGVPVLIHDTTVDRTSNGTGKVGDFTYEELKKLDFGSWKGKNFTGTIIPTFEEFLQLVSQLHMKPYVELKAGMDPELLPGLVKLVRLYGMEQDVTFISFDANLLDRMGQEMPGVRLGYLVVYLEDVQLEQAQNLTQYGGEVFLDCGYSRLQREDIEKIRARGIGLEVWTVNDQSWIDQMDPYIFGITSDQLGVVGEQPKTWVRSCRWCDYQEIKTE